VAVAAAVALAGCAGSEQASSSGPLDGVEVSGDINSKPTVTLPEAPFSLAQSQTKVLIEGDGEATTAEDSLQVQFTVIKGVDGSELQSSYDQGPTTVNLSDTAALPYLLTALTDRTIGDRLLIGLAPVDQLPPGQSQGADASGSPTTPTDTLVYVVDLIGLIATQAEGEAVTDVPADLPQVQTSDDGAVTGITVPGGEPPTQLVVQPLIVGDGPEVTPDATLTVQYWGVLWSDGSTFDSSWERGQPAQFPLSGVIAGWTQGLAGQTVGSRVLLVVPPDLGYGDQEQNGIPGGSTLVFAVDILAA